MGQFYYSKICQFAFCLFVIKIFANKNFKILFNQNIDAFCANIKDCQFKQFYHFPISPLTKELLKSHNFHFTDTRRSL